MIKVTTKGVAFATLMEVDTMFKMTIDKQKKVFRAEVSGFMTMELAEKFVKDYEEIVSKINPKEYTLIVGAKELKASTRETLPILAECFKFYMKDGFKQIYMTKADSPTCQMQLKRVGKETNFTGTFVEEDAIPKTQYIAA